MWEVHLNTFAKQRLIYNLKLEQCFWQQMYQEVEKLLERKLKIVLFDKGFFLSFFGKRKPYQNFFDGCWKFSLDWPRKNSKTKVFTECYSYESDDCILCSSAIHCLPTASLSLRRTVLIVQNLNFRFKKWTIEKLASYRVVFLKKKNSNICPSLSSC